MENLFRPVDHEDLFSRRCIWVNGPVIVGAGPSGLATAACLREQGVPFVVLERLDCIASLWEKRTYDRLKLHLPKQFCQLPKLPFLQDFPEYPTKKQFIEYLESYAWHFEIKPQFNECVQSARYDETSRLWRIKTVNANGSTRNEVEYICRWLVVATGENAECVMPEIQGLGEFKGDVIHACDYKSGERFSGKKVLALGRGNSGMELSLDLRNHQASPSMFVRSSEHVGEVHVVVDQDPGVSVCSQGYKQPSTSTNSSSNQEEEHKPFNSTSSNPSSDHQEHNPSIPSFHAIFIFLVTLLLGVLQVEYQTKKESPFVTHPVQMQTFLVAVCIYSAVLGNKIQNTQQARCGFLQDQILSFALLVCGSVSSGAIFSILLYGVLRWLVLIILGFIPVILGRHLLKNSVYWIIGSVAKLDLKGKFSTMVSILHRKETPPADGSSINQTDRVAGI